VNSWREVADAGRWADVDWYYLPGEDLPDLLERLRRAVPTTKDVKGMEVAERHIRAAETSVHDIKAAALVLQLGELQAAVEGDPPDASERWAAMQDEVTVLLREAVSRGEAIKGSTALSRTSHVRDALHNLEQAAFTTNAMAAGCDDEDQAKWSRESAAEVALAAFAAGVEGLCCRSRAGFP